MAVATDRRPLSEFRKTVKGNFWSDLFSKQTGLPPTLTRTIGGILIGDTKKRFDTRTAPDGSLWPALRFPRVTGGNKPLLDTGVLRNSIRMELHPDGASAVTNLQYGALHQFGGIIVPVKAKSLSIPLTLPAKKAGSPLRFRGNLFFVPAKRKGGNTFGTLCESTGKGKRSKVTAHYLLVRKVVVPARPFMGISAEAERDIDEVLDEWVLSHQRSG